MTIGKRCFVRLISFGAAIILALGALAVFNFGKASALKQQLQYGYLRSLEELSLSVDNIKTTLNKGMYAGSGEMLSELSSKLWSDASAAKISLSMLPVEELNLEKTNKFLSQVGNYSKSLAKRYSAGEELTAEETQNVKTLYEFAEKLSEQMWAVEEQIQGGYISFDRAAEAANDAGGGAENPDSSSVTDGFTGMEEGFDNYPTLIYDGPFSDHIMEREPLLLKDRAAVTQEQALERATTITGAGSLAYVGDETGNMPSFIFESDTTTIAMTKAGGFFSYMIRYREIGDKAISTDDAIMNAKKYLAALGITSVTDTYYEVQSGLCTINFAGVEDNIVLYTDLIKVGVAMDTGEVLSFDARGYITNHHTRSAGEPTISAKEAAMKLSPSLEAKKMQLCIIPSDGLNERYCYEFLCNDAEGRQVLVYINADTGYEEQILLLQISDTGMLTV